MICILTFSIGLTFQWTLSCVTSSLLGVCNTTDWWRGEQAVLGGVPANRPGWRGATCRCSHPHSEIVKSSRLPAYSSGLVAREMSATARYLPLTYTLQLSDGSNVIQRNSSTSETVPETNVLLQSSFPQPNNAYLILNAFH